MLVSYKAASSNQASRTTGAQRWELHELVEVAYFEWCCHTNDKFASVLAFMAAKAALLLLLSSAAAYRCQRVVPVRSDARTSTAVIAAERRRRFNAAAALIGVAAAPSTARAITWKVRDRRLLHWTSRGDGVEDFDSKRSILDYIYVPSTRRRRPPRRTIARTSTPCSWTSTRKPF